MAQVWIPLLVVLAILFRIVLHFCDKSGVARAAPDKGWKHVSVDWAPFAPGWFFEQGERHCRVDYSDENGVLREAYCKTSMFTGLYWRDTNP